MATTTMGRTTSDISTARTNKTIYWGLIAALVVLLIFAFTASRNSTLVTPLTQSREVPASPPLNAVKNTESETAKRSMETSPAVDSTPMNSMASPRVYDEIDPNADVVNPNGIVLDPSIMKERTPPMEPGTSVSPEAPMGTVKR